MRNSWTSIPTATLALRLDVYKRQAQVIELWTGVPAVKIKETEYGRLQGLEDALKAHIIGQDEADVYKRQVHDECAHRGREGAAAQR